MSVFDETIARATRRLSVDPELQRDVARELAAHLEDSAADFARGGQIPPEADASALKALGNTDELADDLWRANRRRMSWRAVARWTLQIATVPAAIAVIVLIVIGMAGSGPRLTEDQRLILGWTGAGNYASRMKALVERFPDNPVYFAQYASVAVKPSSFENQAELSAALTILDRGESIEPDNSYYNVMKGALLLRSSAKIERDPTATYESKAVGHASTQPACFKATISDRARFDQGFAELRRAAAKPKFTSHNLDMLDIRLGQLPGPRRLRECISRFELTAGTLAPPLVSFVEAGKILDARALGEARRGNSQEAARLLDCANRLALKCAEDPYLIALLAGYGMRQQALGHAQVAYELLGDTEKAKAAKAAGEQDQDLHRQIRAAPRRNDGRRAGMFWQNLMPGVPGYSEHTNVEPIRSTENWVAAEGALVLMLAAAVLVLALLLVKTGLDLLLRKRPNRPILLLLPWRTLWRICSIAIVLPLAAYALYVAITLDSHSFGLNYMVGKLALEWVFVFGLVVVLLVVLAGSAIRRRAIEIGIEAPPTFKPRNRLLTIILGGLILLAAVSYVALWDAGPLQPSPDMSPGTPLLGADAFADPLDGNFNQFWKVNMGGFAMAGVVGLFIVAWLVRELSPILAKRYTAFRLTLVRSLVPVVACAVIFIGTICGLVTAYGETQAVQRIKGNAEFSIRNEVERSDYRLLRDRYEQIYKSLPPMK